MTPTRGYATNIPPLFMNPQIVIEKSASALVANIAERLVLEAASSIAARGRFSLVLAGGSTPRALYQLLATNEYRQRIDWDRVLIFFGDERAVAPDDERSNYRMASESFLNTVPIPAANVYRMHGEASDLEAAASDYENELKFLGMPFDMVLLGMGDDGHTASLFPHTPALDETARRCVATAIAPLEPHVRRLTLTYPALNAARHIFIIVTGAGKAERLALVLSSDVDVQATPVVGVRADNGELVWMLDEAAAGQLRR